MQKSVERKLLDHGPPARLIYAINGDPAPAGVAADGVGFDYIFVKQPVDKIAPPASQVGRGSKYRQRAGLNYE